MQCLYSVGKNCRLILLSLLNIMSINVTYTTIWFLHMDRLQLTLQPIIFLLLMCLSMSKITHLQRVSVYIHVCVTISITTSMFNYWLCCIKPVCNIRSVAECRKNTYVKKVVKILCYSSLTFFLASDFENYQKIYYHFNWTIMIKLHPTVTYMQYIYIYIPTIYILQSTITYKACLRQWPKFLN